MYFFILSFREVIYTVYIVFIIVISCVIKLLNETAR